MAFPTVVGRSGNAGSGFPITPTLPTGSIGDLVVIAHTTNSNSTVTTTAGTGWNKLGQITGATGAPTTAVFWKILDGVGDTPTLSFHDARWSYTVQRISGAAGVSGSSSRATSTNSNPASHNPGLGAKDFLWLALRGAVNNTSPTAYPSGYSNGQNFTGVLSSRTNSQSCERERNAASEDPGVFTSVSAAWCCWTLAIEPAGGGDPVRTPRSYAIFIG